MVDNATARFKVMHSVRQIEPMISFRETKLNFIPAWKPGLHTPCIEQECRERSYEVEMLESQRGLAGLSKALQPQKFHLVYEWKVGFQTIWKEHEWK